MSEEMVNNEVMEEVTAAPAQNGHRKPRQPETPAAPAEASAVPAPAAQAAAAAAIPTPAPAGVQAAVAETQASFTPEEQAKIDQFAETSMSRTRTMVLQYGVGAQQKLAEFSGIRPDQRQDPGSGTGRRPAVGSGHGDQDHRRGEEGHLRPVPER